MHVICRHTPPVPLGGLGLLCSRQKLADPSENPTTVLLPASDQRPPNQTRELVRASALCCGPEQQPPAPSSTESLRLTSHPSPWSRQLGKGSLRPCATELRAPITDPTSSANGGLYWHPHFLLCRVETETERERDFCFHSLSTHNALNSWDCEWQRSSSFLRARSGSDVL